MANSDFSNLTPLGEGPNAWWVSEVAADISRQPEPSRLVHVPTDTKLLRLDLNKAACIIVDMQNDFCHPEGWLGQSLGGGSLELPLGQAVCVEPFNDPRYW